MKYLLLISFLVAFSQAYNHEEWKRVGFVQPFILSTLVDMDYTGCRHLRDSIEVDRKNALDCLAEIKSNSSFCYTFVDHFGRCTKNLVDKVESCINQKRQGIPTAFVNLLVEQARFICGTDGEHILEIINPCVFRTLKNDAKNCTRIFDKNVRKIRDDTNTKILPAACREVSDLKSCITEPFEAQCQSTITRNTFQELFQATTSTCKIVNEI